MTTDSMQHGQELQKQLEDLDKKIEKILRFKAGAQPTEGNRLHFLISAQNTRDYEYIHPDDLPADDLLEVALVRIRKRRLDLQTQFDNL